MCQAPKPPKSLRCINQFNQPQQISVWKAEGEARQLVLGLHSVSAHMCTCVYIYIYISLSLYLSISLSLSVYVYNKRNVPAQGVGTSLPAPGARISSARAMDCSDYAKLHRHKFERYTVTTPPDPQQFLARRFTSWGNTWQYWIIWISEKSPNHHISTKFPHREKRIRKVNSPFRAISYSPCHTCARANASKSSPDLPCHPGTLGLWNALLPHHALEHIPGGPFLQMFHYGRKESDCNGDVASCHVHWCPWPVLCF